MLNKLMIHLRTIISVQGVTISGNLEYHDTKNKPNPLDKKV